MSPISRARTLLAVSWIFTAMLAAGSDAGTVEGKIVLHSVNGDRFDTVPNATLRLTTEDKRTISIRSDENGVFAAELKDGLYCIDKVSDATNKRLRRTGDQSSCFRIMTGNHTHFDVRVQPK